MSWTDAFRSIDELPPLHDSIDDPRAALEFDEARRNGFAAGVAEGRSRGLAEGRADAEQRVLDEARSGLDAIALAADDLRRRDAVGIATVHCYVVDLALAIAAAVIGREVDCAIDPGRDALARALETAPGTGAVEAHLHPEDLALLGGVDDLLRGRELRLVADPSVGRGGATVDVGPSHVDARISTALDRVRVELSGMAAPDGEALAREIGEQ